MNLPFSAPTPLDYFTSLVQSDVDFPLLEAAISVAQDEYPDMDVQTVLNVVDQLLERLRRRIPADAAALQRLRVLNQFCFWTWVLAETPMITTILTTVLCTLCWIRAGVSLLRWQ